jgi:hypothetical protein
MGIFKMLKKIQTCFWWPKISEDIHKYLISCGVCQRNETHTMQPGWLLQPLKMPKNKWECLSIDFIIKFVPANHNYDIIFVCVQNDSFYGNYNNCEH